MENGGFGVNTFRDLDEVFSSNHPIQDLLKIGWRIETLRALSCGMKYLFHNL